MPVKDGLVTAKDSRQKESFFSIRLPQAADTRKLVGNNGGITTQSRYIHRMIAISFCLSGLKKRGHLTDCKFQIKVCFYKFLIPLEKFLSNLTQFTYLKVYSTVYSNLHVNLTQDEYIVVQ